MPTTPAQLRELIASAVAIALTNQRPLNQDLFNATNSESSSIASIGTENENLGGPIIRPAIHVFPANLYRQTTSITNKALKRNHLSDSNTDNSKRKAAILIIFKSGDLLILSKPNKSSIDPNGYTSRRCITNEKGGEESLNIDDEYLYRHDINRLYLAMIICISHATLAD